MSSKSPVLIHINEAAGVVTALINIPNRSHPCRRVNFSAKASIAKGSSRAAAEAEARQRLGDLVARSIVSDVWTGGSAR